jgi:hypothetical protein
VAENGFLIHVCLIADFVKDLDFVCDDAAAEPRQRLACCDTFGVSVCL